ncbi:hypothetical protein CASFOL_031071 [Castilleja foliolosa]|uniref:Uncharacterized protein n=1 Tax=Castilleja foliolosa TaxID=1961234 RepID=A0ABD3C3R4_9LAMI
MDKCKQKHPKKSSQEVSSIEWETIEMSEEEEDIINRMYKLVGINTDRRQSSGQDSRGD